MKTATEQLIEKAERLRPTGVIGDGMVAEFRYLAERARAERGYAKRPPCFASNPGAQESAENGCDLCLFAHGCLDI